MTLPHRFLTFLAALAALAALACPAAAHAQAPTPGLQVPGGAVQAQPAGTIAWEILQQARTVQKPDKKFVPEFTREIRALDRKDVKLYGFMMPLDQAARQKRFLLASFPPHCAFCLPGGPESMVEVIADKAIEFTFEPIVVSGRLAVLDNDVVYYRLTNAALQP
jgi:hypothetical protein